MNVFEIVYLGSYFEVASEYEGLCYVEALLREKWK